MTTRFSCLVLVTCLSAIVLSPPVYADEVISICVSYKIVLDPASGKRPSGPSGRVKDDDIDEAIGAMNAMLESYFRGFRMRRVDLITEIGGMGDTNGPSKWYDTDFFDEDDGEKFKNQMEGEAQYNPGLYVWNDNAINIYITNGINGGICSFPGDNIIIIGGSSANDGIVHLHEIGHFFDLCHTQGCDCGCCEPGETGACDTEPGDDKISDTLPDLACWSRNNISFFKFGAFYSDLTRIQQEIVDNVFLNLMSYRDSACGFAASTTRLTELQLDQWTDTVNKDRRYVADGRTYFVEAGGGLDGSSKFPFGSIMAAVSAVSSAGGDVIMIKPGAYLETLAISKRVTLRATRQGSAVIGSTVLPMALASKSPKDIDEELLKIPGISGINIHARLGFAGGSKNRKLNKVEK